MEFKLPDIKEPRMVELWAMVIIVCFNLAFLVAVVSKTHLPESILHWLLLSSQSLVVALSYVLLKRHLSRSFVEEMREASIEQRKTFQTVSSATEARLKEIEAQQKIYIELIDRLMALKNLPPK